MKNLILLMVLGLGFAGCAGGGVGGSSGGSSGHAAPYYVSGTVVDPTYPGASRTIHFVVDADTDKTNGNLLSDTAMGTTGQTFQINGLTAGTYFVYAWKDVDASGSLNSGDNYSAATQIVITNDDVLLGSSISLASVLP